MKHKKLFILTLIAVFAVGMTGCSNNSNKKIEEMKRYAEEKYDKEFTVEYFKGALDATYKNTLTLSDDELIFNVFYREETDVMRDDYITNLIAQKYSDYLSEKCNVTQESVQIHSLIYLGTGKTLDVEYVRNTDIRELKDELGFSAIFLTINTANSIKDIKNELFDLYNTISEDTSGNIELSVVVCDEKSSKLEKSLTNLYAYYERDFSKYPEIKEYIHIIDKDISSADELVSAIKYPST